jgi:excisionase family DNA binding protein
MFQIGASASTDLPTLPTFTSRRKYSWRKRLRQERPSRCHAASFLPLTATNVTPATGARDGQGAWTMSDEGYLTTADALAYLRTTPRTLYRRLATGEIPAVRMGHQWRFRKTDLDRWVEHQSRRSALAENTGSALVAPVHRRRILVVDDESSVCETLTRILAITECDIEAVPDGLSAIERLRVAAYDLLITDLRMPGIGGIELAREAKRLRPGIKVVIATGYPSQSSAIDAVNIGVDGYLTKPFGPIDVVMATARALNLGPNVS